MGDGQTRLPGMVLDRRCRLPVINSTMLHNFLGPFVWWGEVKQHQELKEQILPVIDHLVTSSPAEVRVPGWNCEVYTSYGKKVNFLEGEKLLKEVVWDPLDACFTEVQLSRTPAESRLAGVWFNQYEGSFFQEVHDHGDASFSGIYILELNEPNTTAFFHQGKDLFFQETLTTEHIKEGNVIIFPSSLLHYVNPCQGKRTTISFNVHTQFR